MGIELAIMTEVLEFCQTLHLRLGQNGLLSHIYVTFEAKIRLSDYFWAWPQTYTTTR